MSDEEESGHFRSSLIACRKSNDPHRSLLIAVAAHRWLIAHRAALH
jgi:hypothetical protein